MVNKARVFFVLVFLSVASYGQSKVEPLFKKADSLYERQSVDSALAIYQIITDSFATNPAFSRAFYNVGYASWELKRYDKAIEVFRKVIKSNFNDKDQGPGEGIMAEPYALYKHRACKILSKIYLTKENYDSALKYLVLADKKYPYVHFCGNESAENDIYMAVQYSKCYDGLHEIDKAINVLKEHIFYNGLADNSEAVEQMKIVLLKKYDKAQIVEELKEAEKTIEIKRKKGNERAFIIIFGSKIELPNEIDLNRIARNIKYSEYEELEKKCCAFKGIEKYKIIYTTSAFYRAFVN